MSNYTCYVGKQIRKYRKAGKMTLQDLADAIHKSRATICKYENGEIAVDIETLYEISQVLQVSISQLTTYLPETTSELISTPGRSRKSPFFRRNDYISTSMTDDINARKMASLIFMRRKVNPESTKRL